MATITIMTVRCDQCGHENNPEYRFCGMCGAPISPVTTVRESERARLTAPVGGPSFLGLGDDSSSDLDYLLDDEPPRGHARMYLALLLLLVSAGLLAWHWQRDGYPWDAINKGLHIGKASSPAPPTSAVTAQPPPIAAPEASSTTPSAAPANVSADAPSPAVIGTQAEGGNSPTPTTATPLAGAAPSNSSAVTPPPEGALSSPVAATKPPEQDSPVNDGTEAIGTNTKPQAVPSPGVSSPGVSSQGTGSAEAIGAVASKLPALPAAVPPNRAVSKPLPTIPAPSPEDRIVDEGERYLYGRGVRADCAIAQRDLLIGARQSNPKAQTLLGAMYATGHCVNRDLPSAYRWFAKALHGDPGNSRVQRDLEVLWNQMTPGERQLAMKSQ